MNPADPSSEFPQRLPATTADLDEVEVELPIQVAERRNNFRFQDDYRRAKAIAESEGKSGAARVYESLAVLCSCVGNFEVSRKPYFPEWSQRDQRSFIPDDLQEADHSFLGALLPKIKTPWLQARIIDCLYLQRARRDLWPQAVTAYLAAAVACYPSTPSEGEKCFRRALQLRNALGKEGSLKLEAVNAVLDFVRSNTKTLEPGAAVKMLRLVFDTRIGDAAEFLVMAAEIAQSCAARNKFAEAREAWQCCGKWFWELEKQDEGDAAFRKAAGLFEVEGDAFFGLSPARLGPAIDCYLRGVEALRQARSSPDDVARVRQKLRTAQDKERVEMRSSARQNRASPRREAFEGDLEKAAEASRNLVSGLGFRDALSSLVFAIEVVEPARIREDVLKFSELAPLSAMMTKEYADDWGRVTFRQSGLFLKEGEEFEAAMQEAMFEHAREYVWNLRAETFIEPCRQVIWGEHQPSIPDIGAVLVANPIVPASHTYSIACGLHAGMSGDWLVSSHLLAPKFEPILRFMLERKGIDTTNIESDLTQPSKMLKGLLDLAATNSILPAGYLFEIRGILNEKTGYNFRNRIAHGLAGDTECY